MPVQSTGSTVRKCGGSWQPGEPELLDTIGIWHFFSGFVVLVVSYVPATRNKTCGAFRTAAWSACATGATAFSCHGCGSHPPWQCLKTCHRVAAVLSVENGVEKVWKNPWWKALSFRGSQITAALCRGPYCTLWQRVSIYSTEVSLLSNAIEDRIVSIMKGRKYSICRHTTQIRAQQW